MNDRIPSRPEAERLIAEAETMNPGNWGDHSRVVGRCAEAIARAVPGMDSERAYILGLLHDVGRRYSYRHFGHIYDGYRFMLELGYPGAARVCLTHSFCVRGMDAYIGNVDVTEEEKNWLLARLDEVEFDDYDRLIQLADSIGMAEGAAPIEVRMGDVKRRYGHYPEVKWNKNLELKRYFEEKAGHSVEELTRSIRP